MKRRFIEDAENGRTAAKGLSYLTDQILVTLYEFATHHIYPVANPTKAERMTLVATGGYGRGEMAPFSDVDLLFLMPYKSTPWAENVVEFMLYVLWDLGLKVGHATRTPADCIRMAKEDLTIRTALLESRYLCGDHALYQSAATQFIRRIVSTTGKEFVELKLAERDARHKKLGDTRYVVEPNIKEGKGGLRDLQTMWWIARYLYPDTLRSEMLEQNILEVGEYRQFRKAESFLWTVRVALHFLAGRPEERLTFDMQRILSKQLQYKDHPGLSGVERFMKHYFIVAKQVGDLTRIFCAVLEARHQKPAFFARLKWTKKIQGFGASDGRLTLLDPDDFKTNPSRMIKIFAVADKTGLDIHPVTLRNIKHNLSRITDNVREDPEANADFMTVLCSLKEGEINLRRMNEAGVFGRFIPDFGRVVAQMQYDMYHHYTVDEHTIRAVGLCQKIENRELDKDHPLCAGIVGNIINRRVLYVAILLHDIAKGRGGDHSVLGADVAKQLCPRMGLSPAETETVAWLVRYHLLMSDTAFKRDLSDFKTIQDFSEIVKSPERLRLLCLLTVVDIRAVGPGVWNGWKGQLLRDLYSAASEYLNVGHVTSGLNERVNEKHKLFRTHMVDQTKPWPVTRINAFCKRMPKPYWIGENIETIFENALLIHRTDKKKDLLGVAAHVEQFKDMTHVCVYTEDHPGLFARIVGALGVGGASIMGAKIHTSSDGMAVDNFNVQDFDGHAFDSQQSLAHLEGIILDTLSGNVRPKERLKTKKLFGDKSDSFKIEPVVLVDNKASNRSTVIEVNAKDRPGLLYDLAYALYGLKLSIISAHVSTYGERAVDVFYVRDLMGHKLENKIRLRNIENKLLKAADGKPIFEKASLGEAEDKRRNSPKNIATGNKKKTSKKASKVS